MHDGIADSCMMVVYGIYRKGRRKSILGVNEVKTETTSEKT